MAPNRIVVSCKRSEAFQPATNWSANFAICLRSLFFFFVYYQLITHRRVHLTAQIKTAYRDPNEFRKAPRSGEFTLYIQLSQKFTARLLAIEIVSDNWVDQLLIVKIDWRCTNRKHILTFYNVNIKRRKEFFSGQVSFRFRARIIDGIAIHASQYF